MAWEVAMSGVNAIREFEWSPREKKIARQAFESALHRELESVTTETKKRAERIREPHDLWNLERYLTESRKQIDQRFDYRYSVLIFVFGNLIRLGRLSEQELLGLSEDKLDAIRRLAKA
jgi:hypothetical protein